MKLKKLLFKQLISTATLSIIFILTSNLCLSQNLNKNFYSVNGDVYDVKGTDSFLYIGGLFDYIGKNAGGLAAFKETNDKLLPGLPDLGFSPTIHAVCSDGQGGWYIAGHYTHANKIPQEGITHILPDYSIDRRFKPPVINFMNYSQLLFDGKHLYMAGEFIYEYGSNTYKNLLRLDPVTGSFDESWNPSPSGKVIAIEEIGDLIFVSGTFVFIGNHFQRNVAAVSKITGKYVNSFGSSELPNFMHKKNDTLFIGRDDQFIAGIEAFNNALISTQKKDLLLRRFPTEEKIYKSIPDGKGGWFVIGDFSNLDNIFTENIGHINGDLTIDPAFVQTKEITFRKNLCELYLYNNKLYCAGDFKVNYKGKSFQNLLRIDISSGEIDTNFNPSPDSSVYGITVENNILYLGGEFSQINGFIRSRLAAINLITGDVHSWNPGADNTVYDIKSYPNGFFIGGDFSNVNSQPRVSFAAFNKNGVIQNVFLNFPHNSSITEMICSDSCVYFGGDFCISQSGKNYCDLAAYNFRLFSLGSFEVPGVSYKSTAKDWRFALAYDTIFIAAGFDSVNHRNRNYIAAINRHNNKLLNWNINPDNVIDELCISGGKMLLSGKFNYLKHVQSPLVYIAVKNNNLYKIPISLGTGQINDLSWRTNDFIIAGRFDSVNSTGALNIAAIKLNGQLSSWKPSETSNEISHIISGKNSFFLLSKQEFLFDSIKRSYVASINHTDGKLNNWNAGFDKMPRTLTISDSTILFSGSFSFVNGKKCNNIARVNRKNNEIDDWLPIVAGKVYAIEIISDTILIGGSFSKINTTTVGSLCGLSATKKKKLLVLC